MKSAILTASLGKAAAVVGRQGRYCNQVKREEPSLMDAINKDTGAGALFIAIGLFFAGNAWFRQDMGAAFAMGPGYFPFLLGILLIGIGLVIAALGLLNGGDIAGAIPWRGGLLVIGGILFFALTVRRLGIAPALAGSALMAAFAPQGATLRSALLLAVILTVFCLGLFIYGLGLPYPVLGPWLGG